MRRTCCATSINPTPISIDVAEILFRFDVVEVIFTEKTKPHLELIKNAFQLPQSYIY